MTKHTCTCDKSTEVEVYSEGIFFFRPIGKSNSVPLFTAFEMPSPATTCRPSGI